MSRATTRRHQSRSQLTARGAATRARIIRTAAELVYHQGVAATTLEQVIDRSAISKSQFYHYFSDKESLIGAVIVLQTSAVLATHELQLEHLDSLQGLVSWRDFLVHSYREEQFLNGCRIGALANELAASSEHARIMLAAAFTVWQSYIAAGLVRMQDNGELDAQADPQELATGVIAALEGGALLAKTAADIRPFEIALDMALRCVASYVTVPGHPPEIATG